MPCVTPEPSRNEKEAYKMALLLNYLRTQDLNVFHMGVTLRMIDEHIQSGDWGNTENIDIYTKTLCDVCASIDGTTRENILWDGRVKEARMLAEWWQNHQEADKERIREEALAKLTKLEREVLGL